VVTSGRGVGSFTVIVPAYNEGAALRRNVEAIRAFLVERTPLALPWSILIVDDASGDETLRIATALAREDQRIHVLRRASNGGVDAAIRSGVEAIDSDVAVVLDADLSYDVEIVATLLERLERDDADVVVASAYTQGGAIRNVPRVRASLSRWANRILSYAARHRVSTLTCMVRAYRMPALRPLLAQGAGDMTYELLLTAIRSGLNVCEVPATLEWAPHRRSRMSPGAIVGRAMRVLVTSVRTRPSLALAIPGLIPGVLPVAVAIAAWAHSTPVQLGIVASTTFAVQTASLIVFGFHATNIVTK
jgi:dolichol-phosphate mannosyltransferase